MSFADTTKQTIFKKTNFIELPQGKSIIRILDKSAVKKMIHYVNSVSIECNGEDCLLCLNNRKIYQENPTTFRQIKGYYPRRPRFFCNVLDKTPVKFCSKCETPVKAVNNIFPMVCPACNENIVPAKIMPLNQVRVLSKGPELFDQFNNYESSIQDKEGNPIPIQSYDFMLIVSGTGKETKSQAVPMLNDNDPVEVKQEDLFSLEEAGVVRLNAEELQDFLKGVSIKDIYNARKINKTSDKKLEEEIKTADSLANQIADELMNN